MRRRKPRKPPRGPSFNVDALALNRTLDIFIFLTLVCVTYNIKIGMHQIGVHTIQKAGRKLMPAQHLSQLMPSCGIMTADPVSYRAATSPHHTACIAIATGETVSYATLDQLIGNCVLWLRNTLGQAKSARVAMLARNS